MPKNVKIKTFHAKSSRDLEHNINEYINEEVEDCEVLDVKFCAVYNQSYEETGLYAMVIYL